MSRCLSDRSIDHVVLERGEVANSWRTQRWDSLRLLTPNWMTRLPGFAYRGDDLDGYLAAPHGIATAAGCQLVATSDLAIASDDCRFATSGVRYGLFCSTPGVAVARNVGRKHAMEMLLTGRFVDASTAEKWGLINRAVPLEDLEKEVMALVNELAQLSPYALRIGKEGFYRQVEEKQAEAYRLMAEAISCNAVAPDGQEGIAAFVEKRAPVWKNGS